MAGTIWDNVLARIETKVNRFSYYSWFRQTSFLDDSGGTITIRVADPMVVDWLTKHYAGVLGEALAEVGREGAELKFVPDSSGFDATEASLPAAPMPEPPPTPAAAGEIAGLSPRYSFEAFIVGAGEELGRCRVPPGRPPHIGP